MRLLTFIQRVQVLVRCDLNVPLDGKTITDDTRIRASIPTIEYLKKNGAKVLLSSHLGRPKDGPEDKFSLGPVAPRLSELLGTEVKLAPDCIGDGVKSCVDAMADGDVLLLENTRFYKEEEKNVPEFAEKLAANADLFVNDAFGTAHRAHGSTEGVTKYLDTSVDCVSQSIAMSYFFCALQCHRPFLRSSYHQAARLPSTRMHICDLVNAASAPNIARNVPARDAPN